MSQHVTETKQRGTTETIQQKSIIEERKQRGITKTSQRKSTKEKSEKVLKNSVRKLSE